MALTFRNGYPTKKSICKVIEDFPYFTFHSLWPSQLYTNKNNVFKTLNYSRLYETEQIENFMTWAYEAHGIEFESHRPYNSPSTGELRLKKSE